MGKLYLTCLLLLAVAGSIQCSAIGAEIKPENEEVGIGGGSCGPVPVCTPCQYGKTFKSDVDCRMYWYCTNCGQIQACVCLIGQKYNPCQAKCTCAADALECQNERETLRQILHV